MLENMWPISFSHLGFGSWTVPNTVCWPSEGLQHTEPHWRPTRNYFSSSQFTLQRSTVSRRSMRARLAALTEMMGIGSRTTGSFQQSHFLQRVKNVFYIAYFMFVYLPISSCPFTAKTSFAHICFSTKTLPFNLLLILSTRLLMSVRQPSISHLNLVLQNIKQWHLNTFP